jgi:dolichyl-phosphate beta-glucosyltransferase
MDISIIVPAYNEERRIGVTLEKSVAFLGGSSWNYELLVVDDGSSDGTVARVREFAQDHPAVQCLQNDRNRGKGYSIRHGVKCAQGRYIGFMDADYKTDIGTLDGVMECLQEGYDGAIGDRTLAESDIVVARRPYREWGTKVFKGLLLRLFGLQMFGDTQCGFKFFKAEAMRDLFSRQRMDGYMFDVEILLLATRLGYRIGKVAVKWQDDPDSRFNPVSGTIQDLIELVRIRWIHR